MDLQQINKARNDLLGVTGELLKQYFENRKIDLLSLVLLVPSKEGDFAQREQAIGQLALLRDLFQDLSNHVERLKHDIEQKELKDNG